MTQPANLLISAQRCLNREPTATMARIAAVAGVGRATLNRHFASRDALIEAIGMRALDRWASRLDDADATAAVASGDAARIAACIHTLLAGFVVDADEFGFALTDTYLNGVSSLHERVEELFGREVALYEAAQRAGVLRADVPARWLGHAVYGLLIASRDALREGDVARRELPDLFSTTLFTGIGAR